MPVACPAEPSSNSTTVSTSKSPAPQYSCITLLLFVLILPMTMGEHRNYTSPLQLLNPWLSACDLIDPSRTPDLQGVCLATSTMVLLSTPTTDNNPDSNNNNNNENVNNNNNVNINNKPNKVHQNCRVNGDISEGPGPPSMCPCACEDSSPQYSTTTTTPHQNTNQCLDYLNESHKKSVCGSSLNKNERKSALNKLRFQHCCEHTVLASLDAEARKKLDLEENGHTCEVYIDALLQLDALAESITCKFSEVLKRYDCSQTYSVNFQCADCKEAYRRWVCASLFPHFLADSRDRARPCRSVCQQVEQRCPFFLPGDRFPSYPTQYAGEPTFLCIDPNIPETGQQLVKSSYGDGGCCYHYCDGVTGFCYTDQCSTNATTTAVPVHHCEETGSGGGTSRTAVVSACSSSSAANIMVHPPLGGAASGAAHTANKTLLMNLLLHIIFLLVIGMVFGLEFT